MREETLRWCHGTGVDPRRQTAAPRLAACMSMPDLWPESMLTSETALAFVLDCLMACHAVSQSGDFDGRALARQTLKGSHRGGHESGRSLSAPHWCHARGPFRVKGSTTTSLPWPWADPCPREHQHLRPPTRCRSRHLDRLMVPPQTNVWAAGMQCLHLFFAPLRWN